jgi:hypothetical protein
MAVATGVDLSSRQTQTMKPGRDLQGGLHAQRTIPDGAIRLEEGSPVTILETSGIGILSLAEAGGRISDVDAAGGGTGPRQRM